MKFSIEKLPESQVKMDFELASEELEEFYDKAVLNLGREIKMEGFRPGRVPKEIVEQKLGKEVILAEAAELAVRESFVKALIEKSIETISQPEIQVKKLVRGNPFEFEVKVFVVPEVKLPDYQKIARETKKNETAVLKEEVSDALSWVQKSRAKFSLKNEPAQKKDFVEIEYSSPQIENGKKVQDAFVLGDGRFMPDFEKELEGMKDNEEKSFSIVFSKEHHQKNLAGQKVDFTVKVKSVQKMELPELSDDFAKSLGNFQNKEALEDNIKEGIKAEKDAQESQRVRQEILDKISQEAKIEIPEILIKKEQERLMEMLKEDVMQKLGIEFSQYLERIKKTEKELFDSFATEAKNRISRHLVLLNISKAENIKATEEEISQEAAKIKQMSPEMGQLDPEKIRNYTEEVLKNEKTLQFLENLIQK